MRSPCLGAPLKIRITVGPDLCFIASLEQQLAPQTCAAFLQMLPLRQRLIQARWSGEAAWVPLGELDVGVGAEHETSHPAPGELLLYPRGRSETEILFPYGTTVFSSKHGQLAGNHFLTIIEGREHLAELGRRVAWEGAQDILFEVLSPAILRVEPPEPEGGYHDGQPDQEAHEEGQGRGPEGL